MTKILVIEDERAILDNVIETLQMEGFEVRGAPNGRIGVQVAREYLPDLVVCDIMMPELSGYGVLLELRSDAATSNIPFMFLTAKSDRADMRRGMELGADDYLIKPFTTVELLAAVEARLARHNAIAQKYEQKLESLRGNIVRALPHELRTPLTGIIGYSEILLMDSDFVEQNQTHAMIEVIHKSGMRLHHVIENYLVYAQTELMLADKDRAEAARQAQPVGIQPVIRNIATQKALMHGRADDLQLDIQPVAARIYQESLEKIIEELVDNAFKFSQPGTPVYVQAAAADGAVALTIRDSGRGITPEHMDKIGAYMQFERAIYEQQGLGLGLIIAKRLAEIHGGQFEISSQPGEGTTISIRLRLAA